MLLLFACELPQDASATGTGVPDAGYILKLVVPTITAVPFYIAPKVIRAPVESAPAESTETLVINNIRINGNTVFSTPLLHGLLAGAEGKTLTLVQVFALAGRITEYYQAHGYPLNRAFIPEQTIQKGQLLIEVIEVRYGKILIRNHSRLREQLLKDTTSGLQKGELINEVLLDKTLLLLADIPGIEVIPSVGMGADSGTTDLHLNITPQPLLSGDIQMNNHGNSYTGLANLRGNFYLNNPLRLGDLLVMNVLTAGTGMNYARAAYESLTSGSGTKVGGSLSGLHYAIGGSLASMQSSGAASVSSLWVKQPVLRNRDKSLYVQLQIDHSALQDHTEAASSPAYTDRHIQSSTFNIYGELHDSLWHQGLNTWNLSATRGRVQFDNATALSVDQSASHTAGYFAKYNLAAQRVETISVTTALHLTMNMQHTANNLDSSQKMDAGGPYSVRAYLAGIRSSDSGYFASMELRHALGIAYQSQWTATLFTDLAGLRTNPSTSATTTSPTVIKGAGAGLMWSGPSLWSGSSFIAWPVSDYPSGVSSHKPARVYVTVQKGF